ncbi:MAG: SpoIVB peptidase [Oscillospiraceae bacterium]|nr:SpoIVB peptidase [Oscillospiraceae bacterium]
MKFFRRATVLLAAFTILLSVAPGALAARPTALVPVGQTVGIDIKSEGVIVVGMAPVETAAGPKSPATLAGLHLGDIITQVGGQTIQSAADFKAAIDAAAGQTVTVQVSRAEQQLQMNLSPVADQGGNFELGLRLRDGMAGIGTVTFYDPKSGIFGALGHAVSEVETGVLIPLHTGTIMPARVQSARRGTAGAPGELQGEFDFSRTIGTLFANTPTGIFGQAADGSVLNRDKALPIGGADELKLGAAQILANVSGTQIQTFDIEISRLFAGGADRNMMITVTDPALIAVTGGIVQGMSGSPILQNGKLVGAVTHVLVNNPEKGYGISIDSMLQNAYGDIGVLAAA